MNWKSSIEIALALFVTTVILLWLPIAIYASYTDNDSLLKIDFTLLIVSIIIMGVMQFFDDGEGPAI